MPVIQDFGSSLVQNRNFTFLLSMIMECPQKNHMITQAIWILPEDRGENIRREICLTLEQMGIQPESSHHEEGPGQNEIDFRYSDPLTAADNAMTFQSVVKTVAGRNGLFADFSPKPLKNKPGNGFHI